MRYYKYYNEVWVEVTREIYVKACRETLSMEILGEYRTDGFTYGICRINYFCNIGELDSELMDKLLEIHARYIVYNRFHVNYLDIRTLMQGQFFAKEEEAFKVYKDKWFNPQLSLAC